MSRSLLLIAAVLSLGAGPTRVGSKADSESILLGEVAARLVRQSGGDAEHKRDLGGTLVLWEALKTGAIDCYPEFTGTLAFQVYRDPALTDFDRLRARLDGDGVGTTAPLGYENNYALGVPKAFALANGLTTTSQLAALPGARLGLTPEFLRRPDGWPALRTHYNFRATAPQTVEHAVAYRAAGAGQLDAIDVYTTDAEIERYGLTVLSDDRSFFPHYQAVFVYRRDWAARNPEAAAALNRLAGKLTEAAMRAANAKTQAKVSEAETARELVETHAPAGPGSVVQPELATESLAAETLRHTREHIVLAGGALLAAVLVAVPLGVLADRRPRLGQLLVGVAGLLQTVPSLALLVILLALPVVGGLGTRPAVTALFLYALLPILSNTLAGLRGIPPQLREVADGLGLSSWAKLRRVELPLAMRSILTGVRTAAVIAVGTATLGVFVGAGGLGVPIQQGLRTNDDRLLLAGAVPAALLALAAQGLFGLLERRLVPRGLRLTR